ncbi:hypothetical protein FDECE_15078 [Fusarium decemcellulare]|nr:hypothetical protein FDECE_15078 [Fusarium decemcellulare]
MPNYNKGGPQPRTQAAIPTKFRCKVGGEWKPLSEFSKNQQRLIQYQIDSRREVKAAHSGMTCKEHTAKSIAEYRCELCNLIKPADNFSKNSLRNEEYICVRCVAWTETQEPSVVPAPLETGHISVEEEQGEVWRGDFDHSAEFFTDPSIPSAPITGLGGIGLEELPDGVENARLQEAFDHVVSQSDVRRSQINMTFSESASVVDESKSTTTTTTKTNQLPPHLAGFEKLSLGTETRSETSKVSGSQPSTTQNLPPHLRGVLGAGAVSSGSGLSSQRGPGSVSTATTIRKDREEREISHQVKFNAYDPRGKRYEAVKNPTLASSSVSTTSASETGAFSDSNVVGGGASLPPKGRGRWPLASEIRIPQSEIKKQPILPHTRAKHIDPEVDKQRRKNYCDSDDSDY